VLELGLGDEARFAADLEAAFAIAPDASLARALADRSAKAGDAAGADRWSRAAHALDPSADSGTWTTRPGPR